MSTTIAISTAALASSAAAQSAAREARKSACVAVESSYRPELATVESKQVYAECILLLYPAPAEPMTAGETTALQVLAVGAFACFLIGAVMGWRDEGRPWGWENALGAFFGGCMGLLIALLALFVFGGLTLAATWALSQ